MDAFDRAKAWAILAVVATHALPAWHPLVVGLAFHVPTFLLLSGTLYRADCVTGATVRRRLARVLLPYGVAIAGCYALGLAPLPGPRAFGVEFVTGSTLGVYYFIPILAGCVLLTWPLARAGPRMALALVGLCAVAVVAIPLVFARPSLFWAIRDPFRQFWLGYFLLGWLGLPARLLVLSPIASVALVATGIALSVSPGPPWLAATRVLITAGMFGLIGRVPVPGWRWLSGATLGVYLWHRPAQRLLTPLTTDWSAGWQLTAAFIGGLSGAVVLLVLVRGLVGDVRARRWIGA